MNTYLVELAQKDIHLNLYILGNITRYNNFKLSVDFD